MWSLFIWCNRSSFAKISSFLIISTPLCNILFVIASIFYWILLYVDDDCKRDDILYNSLGQNSGLIGFTSYAISLALLFVMLSKRLILTFDDTENDIILICICTIPIITYLFLMWSPWAFYTGGMMLGTYSIMSIILLSLFVKKLRQITSQRLVSAQSDLSLKMAYSSSTNDNVSDNDNDTNDNVGGGGRSPSASSVESMDRHDFELIQIMTKYTILVFLLS